MDARRLARSSRFVNFVLSFGIGPGCAHNRQGTGTRLMAKTNTICQQDKLGHPPEKAGVSG
jgi:hypothetical protein